MPNPPKVALLALVLAPTIASAEGEYGPMFGGSIVATHGTEADVTGVSAELAFWHGYVGIAVEASHQWTVNEFEGPQVGAVAGSLRLLVFDRVVPSLVDSHEVVDLGLELQAIVERTWWKDSPIEYAPLGYGVGLALRLRGVNDDDRSTLLAESRLFIRVMVSQHADSQIAARSTMASPAIEDVGVIIGLGALFGSGQPAYVQQLRRRNTLDAESIVR